MPVEKPLPVRQLAIICACRFAEPICFTVIFPFIIFMIRDFHVGDEAEVGYYVGIITSSFALAQLVSGIPWGILSDRIGRRPVILSGLVGTTISILLLGLSKSYGAALFARVLCGLLNGNVGVLKSMMGEITLEHTPAQRTRAFSLLPLMFGLGSIIGPILGGILSNPVRNFPDIFGRGGVITDFLLEYPYFLPCFISGLAATFSFVFGYFYLEETLDIVKEEEIQEQEPLLSSKTSVYSTFDADGQTQPPTSPRPTLCGDDDVVKAYEPPSFRDALTPAVLAICLTYSIFSFQAIYYDELFPIWTASSKQIGGLAFASDEIGVALAFSGTITLSAQLFLLPTLTQRFGLVRLLRFVLFALVFIYAIHGLVRYLYLVPDIHGNVETKFWVWVGLLIIIACKTLCTTISFTGVTILINDAAPRLDTLGAINGFSQCCASGMRALGPATCGIIWSSAQSAEWIPSALRVHVSYAFLALVGAVSYYTSVRLRPCDFVPVQKTRNQINNTETA